MNLANFGAVRRLLLVSAVLTLSAVPVTAQIVERSQTWANLIATHPCNAGLNGRHTILTDAQSSSSIGGGGGSVRVFVECDGVDTWSIVSIGGGASGPAEALASAVVIEGTTADAFEGNFTFADPTADWTWAWGATGNVTIPGNIQGPTAGFTIFGGTSTTADLILQTTTGAGASGSNMSFLVGNNGALEALRLMYDGQAVFRTINVGSTDGTDTNAKVAIDSSKFYIDGSIEIGWASGTPAGSGYAMDTEIGRDAADVVKIDSMIELTPIASGGTCDSGNEGRIYNDSSHALCWCDGTTAQKLSGGGTCD